MIESPGRHPVPANGRPAEALQGLPDSYRRWRTRRLGRITDLLERERILELAGALRGRAVLDIGCGDGDLALDLAQRGANVIGLDLDPRMLAMAQARFLCERAPARLVQASAEALPFASDSFDLVVAITVLCLVGDAKKTLMEAARVMRPGARLVLGELGRWNSWAALRRVKSWLGSPTWRAARFRSPAELRALVEGVGLSVACVRGAIFYPPLGWCASIGARIDRRLGERTVHGAAFIGLAAEKP